MLADMIKNDEYVKDFMMTSATFYNENNYTIYSNTIKYMS